jgi:SMC interacting uncharacterized protein involved in chromosome segregation
MQTEMDTRLELKSFAFQVEQMRMAQRRLEQLKNGASSESDNAIEQMTEMKRQLETVVDDSIKGYNDHFTYLYATGEQPVARISPEQVDADQSFREALEKSLIGWKGELEMIQSDQIEQAIIDAHANGKSVKYLQLEEREKELKSKISEAEQKLGKVSGRVGASPAFSNAVNKVVNGAKRL